jgi:riboflavin synthase
MFTGIITDVGKIIKVDAAGDDGITRFVIGTSYDPNGIDIGASIACSGVCLTVVERGTGLPYSQAKNQNWFVMEASDETLSKTHVGGWVVDDAVNLERALCLGDELGGHMVLGHVDCVARIIDRQPDGESLRFTIEVPDDYKKFIAPKGSVVLDGVSLTINEVAANSFGVNIIPHTCDHTTFGKMKDGDNLNLEIDVLARYIAQLMDK